MFTPRSALDLLPPPSQRPHSRELATMSYNREWDKGKDTWDDQSWNEYPSRGNVRGRDDDYYGEGKRRKYNNGVRGRLALITAWHIFTFISCRATMPPRTGMRAGTTTTATRDVAMPSSGHSRTTATTATGTPTARSARSPASPALTLYSSVSTQTLPRRMFVDVSVHTPPHLSESALQHQLQAYLTNQGRTVETVTIIRDRSTGTYLPLRCCVCTVH